MVDTIGSEILDHVELVTRIKKDPQCHEDNFSSQYAHFERLCQLLTLDPSSLNENLIQLISFISTVVSNYNNYRKKFVDKLVSLIENYGHQMEPTLRLVICKVLLKQRKDNNIDPLRLYQILIALFNCKDKVLRKSLQYLIVSNIKNCNKKHYNNKVNIAIQSYFFKVMQQSTNNDGCEHIVMAILHIVLSLWRKNIWVNEKVANMVSYVCFSDSYKISFTAIKFFLNSNNCTNGCDSDNDDDDEDDDVEDSKKISAMLLIKSNKSGTKPNISRTSRKRKRKLDKALEYMKKIEKKKKQRNSNESLSDSTAIRLLNDPQSFTEKLLKKFNKSKNRFEFKLMIIEVAARVISIHGLIIPNYYTLIQRYLKPSQQNAVRILTALVQSCHNLVPNEYVSACIKTIAENFISQHSASEIAAVGMNTIREICWRSPFAIEESLAQELVSLEKGINGSRGIDKVLAIASKSLLQTLRAVNPKVLLRKDRVRPSPFFYKSCLYKPNAQHQLDDGLLNLAAPTIHSTIPGLENLDTTHIDHIDSSNEDRDNTSDCDEVSINSNPRDNSWESISDEEFSRVTPQPLNNDVITSRFLTDEEFRLIRKNKQKCDAELLANDINLKKSLNKTNHNQSINSILNQTYSSDIDDSFNAESEIIGVDRVAFVSGLKKKHVNPEFLPCGGDSFKQTTKTSADRKVANTEYRDKVFHDWRFNPKASKTQREKNKNKPFMMIRHKKQVRGKAKKSIKEKIATLRKTIKNAGKMRH